MKIASLFNKKFTELNNLLIYGKFYLISPLYLEYVPYITILWTKHRKLRVSFSMFALYTNLKFEIRVGGD